MPISPDLTNDLKKVVLSLEDDLRLRVESQPDVLHAWQGHHRDATAKERTALSWQAWRDDRITQVAVAWVLTTVFIRFCEDNGLLSKVWLAGPPARRQEALDAELAYFRANPEHTAREWILQAVEHLCTVKATHALVDEHSALWLVSPSGQAAKDLVDFWRAKNDDGELLRDFTDSGLSTGSGPSTGSGLSTVGGLSTRFLGDLYQDLSDYAKKTFALLQTPEFVEEFILDQTMEPALAERPLDGFTLIDPTCGSGHFLLGAFARLNDRWATQAPGLEVQARVQKALDSVHGVDLNPFAVAIARFRLIVAALQACGLRSLEDAPAFKLNLAAGDSLLHGGHQLSLQFDGFDPDSEISGFAYATEDLDALRRILTPGRYDVVVGNPPYISVKDPSLRQAYKALYPRCVKQWTLVVPFMERFFALAKTGERSGWIGKITANNFMKRDFGFRLIEEFLPTKDLHLLVDTSGIEIPGHETPTVVIIARNQRPALHTVMTARRIGRETRGVVAPGPGWLELRDHVSDINWEGAYFRISALSRAALNRHPWSLAAGASSELKATIEEVAESNVGRLTLRIGFYGDTHADDAFLMPDNFLTRLGLPSEMRPQMIRGEVLRDWLASSSEAIFRPYDARRKVVGFESLPDAAQRVWWPLRTSLWARAAFSGGTYRTAGLPWLAWHQFPLDAGSRKESIAFAFKASHNHIFIDDGSRAFNSTSPVIKFAENVPLRTVAAVAAILGSSTAAFWLRQIAQHQGGGSTDPTSWTYEYSAAIVGSLPIPALLPERRGERILEGSQRAAALRPESVLLEHGSAHNPIGLLAVVRNEAVVHGRAMIAEQEELDWEVYRLYGLIDEDLTYSGEVPEVSLGERAFEIALARKVAAGEEETAWFSRHGSTPITEIPAHWPADYRDLVQRRLDLIESDKFIRLLEKPEHKRRWASEPWDRQVDKALRSWLLDRLEARTFWFDQSGRPMPKSIGQLADLVARDADLVNVLELWSGKRDQSVATSLTALLTDEAVPFLAAYRLKDSGLRKREAWEHTWDLQRKEDAGTLTDAERPIPVPPKYTNADFRKASWWQARGKLDVPKERFILYPDAGRETDPTLVLGWAGWDQAQQFLALATLIGERQAEGWDDERLVPLVAGLAELQPWVRQWHDEIDPSYGVNMADFCDEQLRDRAIQVGKTIDQLKAWRPAASPRGRKPRS